VSADATVTATLTDTYSPDASDVAQVTPEETLPATGAGGATRQLAEAGLAAIVVGALMAVASGRRRRRGRAGEHFET
jgi:hypothetical protein